MASAGSGGRAAPRDGEANGEPDRSLQLMLRAIAEERSRTGLRHEISGLGEGRRRPGRERAAGGSGRRAGGLRTPRGRASAPAPPLFGVIGPAAGITASRKCVSRVWSTDARRSRRRAWPSGGPGGFFPAPSELPRAALRVGACTGSSGSASRRRILPALRWAYILTCVAGDVCSGVG